MPRIPVRTEPYADILHQHRHYKNKRDLTLRSLGKASYINGSQFAIVFISAKGDVEKYASEMLQSELGEIFVDSVVEGLKGRVKETNDRRREQLDQELRAAAALASSGSGGAAVDDVKPLAPSEVLRSAKKKKKDALEAKRREEEEARLRKEEVDRGRGKGLIKGESDDEDEGEGEGDGEQGQEEGMSDYELEEGQPPTIAQVTTSTITSKPFSVSSTTTSTSKPVKRSHPTSHSHSHKKTNSLSIETDAYLNVDSYAASTSSCSDDEQEHEQDEDESVENVQNDKTMVDEQQDEEDGCGEDTLVEVDDAMMVRKIDAVSGLLGSSSTPAKGRSSGPAHSTSNLSLSFVTPAPIRKRRQHRESIGGGGNDGWEMGVDHDGQGEGEGEEELKSIDEVKRDEGDAMGMGGIPSLTFTTPGGPGSTGYASSRPSSSAHVYHHGQTYSHAHTTYISHPSTSTSTATLTIPPHDLSAYYLSRFNDLQQTTCKLVVKTWIKVIEPKKQSRFPYNKGEEGRPGWWPEGIRHKEPDHLMKPERTELLLAIIRSPVVKVFKLEIATAEASAYIPQAKMKILREVYRVAKEEERRRDTADAMADIVIQAPSSPITGSMAEDTPLMEAEDHSSAMITPLPPNVMGMGMGMSMTSTSAAQAILASTPSRAPSAGLPMGSKPRGRKRQHEVEEDKENRMSVRNNVFVGDGKSHSSSLSKEFGSNELNGLIHGHQSSSSVSIANSRRSRTEPRAKKPRSMTLDQVATSEAMGGSGQHHNMAGAGYHSPYGVAYPGPFSSTPLQHHHNHNGGHKWSGAVPHTAPRPGHGHGQGMMMAPSGMLMDHSQHHPMDMGSMLRGGQQGQGQSMASMSRSPALTPTDDGTRPGSSQSYMAYPTDATPSRPGPQGIPHHMAMAPYTYNVQPTYYQPAYIQQDASEYASTPQSASMASIQPTFYNTAPPVSVTYTTTNTNNTSETSATQPASAFSEAMVGNQYGEMGEYVASSGYSVQNAGEFPFVAQS